MDRVGKYQLVRKLATGGMAEVFLARAEGPGGFSKKLVVKRILPHFVSDPTFAQMFLSEARLAAELNHPNVVQIFDFGETEGQYYLAMEYIDGANLRVLNTAAINQQFRIPFAISARIISQAAEGLHFAHELCGEDGKPIGLVHRDISPDNILLSRSGAVKVVDFGIAKANAQPSMTRSGVIKGKMAYMPPEQLGRKPVDRRADVFALGVVLHELVTGTWPFDASSEVSIIQAIMNEVPFTRVRERRSDVPEALEAIIAKCLEKNRDLRYANAKELQGDLENFIASTQRAVQASDLADLVNNLVPPTSNPENSQVAEVPSSPGAPTLDRTFKRELRPGDSGNSLPRVEARPPARSTVPLVIGGILGLVLLGAGAAYVTREKPLIVAPPPVKDPPQVVVVATVDAGAAGVEEPADAGAETVVEAAVDAGAGETTAPDPKLPPVTAVARALKIEFRIRPFAQVFLDGKELGQTPFPSVTVAVGKHKVRLVNEALGKDVEVEHTFHAGDTAFKYNLKE